MSTNHLSIGVQRPVGFEHLGYGSFGLALSRGLRNIGIKVHEPPDIEGYKRPQQNVGTVVWASQPGHANGKWDGQFTVIYSMWESTLLPEAFTANLHNFDLVIVPNEFNVEQFKEFNDNVVKVPLGFESSAWSFKQREMPDQTFNFLHCAAGAAEKARKGTDLVIAAFDRAFPNWEKMTPSPRLTVKCLKYPPEGRDYLTVYQERWDQTRLRLLYEDSHAMVLPSRGEGWGYHPIQAIATGMPAIISDIPGHQEYLWLPGILVVPTTNSPAPQFLQGNGGDWWEPDLDVLTEQMIEVYENYASYLDMAKAGSLTAHGTFSEQNMARGVVDAIGTEHLVVKKTGDWVKYTEREYVAMVNRYLAPGDCTIHDRSYVLKPGEEYWIPANARQVIQNAGYLANPDDRRSRVQLIGG